MQNITSKMTLFLWSILPPLSLQFVFTLNWHPVAFFHFFQHSAHISRMVQYNLDANMRILQFAFVAVLLLFRLCLHSSLAELISQHYRVFVLGLMSNDSLFPRHLDGWLLLSRCVGYICHCTFTTSVPRQESKKKHLDKQFWVYDTLQHVRIIEYANWTA